MNINYEDPKVKQILESRDVLYIRPQRIACIVSDFIGDDLNARGRLFDAIIHYGIEPNDAQPFTVHDGKLFYAWAVIKMDLDDDARFYVKKRLMRMKHHAHE